MNPILTTPLETASSLQRRVEPGDLWQLGSHRLLCGDCTQLEEVARLFASRAGTSPEQADLLVTDPPYGVGYARKTGARQRPDRTLPGDDMGVEGTRRLLTSALRLAPLKHGGVFYVCAPAGRGDLLFRQALEDAGLPLRQALVWVKQAFVLSRQDYHWRHETLLYGWKPGAAHYFVADRTQDTVWHIPRPTKSPLHPTMKPIALVEKAIFNSSRPGEIVYDGFGGSGTTLLACEQTGRNCRMVEIEPQYCEVIIKRSEKAIGRQAKRL